MKPTLRLLLSSLLLLTQAATARAQSDEELQRARTLFVEGVELTEQEEWTEAAARFRAVAEVRSTSQVLYNLAFALSHTEHRAEAARLLHQVLQDEELDRPTRRQAETILAEVEPTLGQITVRLAGDEAGEQIFVDGEEIGLDRVGQPILVDPGSHTAELRRGETVLTSRTVEISAGSYEEVRLSSLSPSGIDIVDASEAGHGSSVAPAIHEQWWVWAIVAGAVVAVGGLIIGIAVASDGSVTPVQGDLDPGVLWVTP